MADSFFEQDGLDGESPVFSSIAIIGLGLIGGSLAKLIHESFPSITIYAVDKDAQAIKRALSDGVIRAGGADLSVVPPSVQLVIVCTPIERVNRVLQSVAVHCDETVLITDVSSVKSYIGTDLELKPGQVFVGGHPMAGTEDQGYMASSSFILRGANYFLTPKEYGDSMPLGDFLEDLGFNVIIVSPGTHDRFVAATSHGNTLMSIVMLAANESQLNDPIFRSCIGPGFRDTTRVAGSSPDWVVDVCKYNQKGILDALERVEETLHSLKGLIQNGDWYSIREISETARSLRQKM